MDIDKVLEGMTLEEKADMLGGSDFWHLSGVERLGVPAIMTTDGPHGLRKQAGATDHLGLSASVPATCFPTASALASSFDRTLLEKVGTILGNECQAEDVGILLGPGLNIKRSPLCGRNFEYMSEDPYLAGELGAAYVKGLQSKGIGCSAKHYAANNQETKRMSTDSVLDERTLREIYLPAFEKVVKEGKAKTLMCSYNKINGAYAAVNKKLLDDILRGEWGFDGFVMTDWGAAKDPVEGVKAGLDLKMPGSGNKDAALKIVAAVESGELDIAVLDASVKRILEVIDFYLANRDAGAVYDRAEDHVKAQSAAQECAILLKNDGAVLPLAKDAKVAFIGEYAKKPRFQGGGSSHINASFVDNAVEAAGDLNITFAQGYDDTKDLPDESIIAEAVKVASEADAAVLFIGLPERRESEGFDRKDLDIPASHNALVEAVLAVQPKTVVVLHNGSSIALPWADKAPAILEMYLGGEGVGKAAVSLLFGDANPSGKIAETFPKRVEDNPSYLNFPGFGDTVEYREGIYVGYRYYDAKKSEVLFPFGHGLSYTQFEYSDLAVSASEINDSESLKVTAKVKNVGGVAGKETVQLYVGRTSAGIPRPIKELKGFEKIALEPGEEGVVEFTLDKRSFAYYNTVINDWHVETGDYSIQIGASSRDIKLEASVKVISQTVIPVVFHSYSTLGEIMKSPKGMAVIGPVLQALAATFGGDQSGTAEAIGVGAELMQAMVQDMPLSTLSDFGAMPKEALNAILAQLNG
ncbi:MAG: glycoside hydrolase family 3 C-terminal domain-containing protein [Clostridiales bacterium]|nr:glycoside hydrolase family 3 C-terminal domain-containing protein [Clostridiales bacterium]